MSDSYIFEIIVNGKEHDKEEYYPITFRVMYKFGRYSVWIVITRISVQCGFFDRKIDAIEYIKQAMKLAMIGKFIFRECLLCDVKNYYPENICKKCKNILYPFENWQIDEMQNEKNKRV